MNLRDPKLSFFWFNSTKKKKKKVRETRFLVEDAVTNWPTWPTSTKFLCWEKGKECVAALQVRRGSPTRYQTTSLRGEEGDDLRLVWVLFCNGNTTLALIIWSLFFECLTLRGRTVSFTSIFPRGFATILARVLAITISKRVRTGCYYFFLGAPSELPDIVLTILLDIWGLWARRTSNKVALE
jgi:hypothetical protein